jgi:hypothetical protein
MPELKDDCANRRLAALLMPFSGLDVVKSLCSFKQLLKFKVSSERGSCRVPSFSAAKKFRIGDRLSELNADLPSLSTNAYFLLT